MENRGIQRIDSIEKNGEYIGRINYQPKAALAVSSVLAAVLVLTRSKYGIILGILIAGIVLFNIVRIKDHPVMDVYSDQLIFYDPDNSEYGVSIPVNEIAEWNINKANMYTIYIRLKDGRQYTEECFHSQKAYRYLNRVMNGKDTGTLQREFMSSLIFRNRRKKGNASK